ncbi:MAG TPA: cytochrome oxidase small assembly protein [Rhodocyclaceae bacterium]|nr:cytochrome oxidase small assembly protein [Rhodocyclaceae bacterium]
MRELETTMQTPDKGAQGRRNQRLGLILGAVALAFFFGYILRAWLLGR